MNPEDEDISWWDATEQARLVAEAHVSPRELVHAALRRIEALDHLTNSVVSLSGDRAFAEATPGNGLRRTPFAGVPILVKDLGCSTAGEPLWCGNRLLKRIDFRARHDSATIRRVRRSGFAVLGRTSTAEFGATITTEPDATGSCRNPWDPTMSVGGSSGGSAAAVAAGFVPIAHGTDASGSIRIPASACGIIGMKPTNGTWPTDRGHLDWFGLSTAGYFSRSVRDLWRLSCAAGDDGRTPDRAVLDAVGSRWQASRCAPLRIAVIRADDYPGLDPENRLALRQTAQLLEAQGHIVREATPDFLLEPDFHRNFVTLAAAGLAVEIAAWQRRIGSAIYPDELDDSTRTLAMLGMKGGREATMPARHWLDGHRDRAARWWQTADVLVTPVLASGPAPLGWFSEPELGPRRVREAMRFTAQFNAHGNPAISLPLGRTRSGLPLGIQFVAATRGDQLLLDLARDLEREVAWAAYRPPLGRRHAKNPIVQR